MKNNKNIYRYNLLTRKLLSGKASSEEMEELAEWKIVSNKMKDQLNKAEKDGIDEKIGMRMWKQINKRCETPENRSSKRNMYLQIAIAACSAIVAIIGTLWFTQPGVPPATEYLAISASNSQLYILPDSSKVWMQAGSTIRFNKDFKKERNVWLTGISTFEVRKKNGIPFKVNIDRAFVEVKGTVFQVWNQKSGQCEVTLFSGKVDFNTNTGKKIELSPRQRIIYQPDKDDIEVSMIGNINWEDGEYRFTDVRLDSLIHIIEDVYHSKITVSPQVNQHHLFTGIIKYDDSITAVIERICYNMNCKYKKESDEITISN